MNGDRIGRWVFTVICALIPPSLAWLFLGYGEGKAWDALWQAFAESPETGFTAIMISAVCWSEVRESRSNIDPTTLQIGEYTFLILIIGSGILYGIQSKSVYWSPCETEFRKFLSNFTVTFALASLILGTIYQILLARIEG